MELRKVTSMNTEQKTKIAIIMLKFARVNFGHNVSAPIGFYFKNHDATLQAINNFAFLF